MALTNITTSNSTGQPSAPFRMGYLKVDLDNSYTADGYDISAQYPDATVIGGETIFHYDGTALRMFKVVNDSGTPKLRAYAVTNGAKGAQVAGATDLSGHTNLEIEFFWQ